MRKLSLICVLSLLPFLAAADLLSGTPRLTAEYPASDTNGNPISCADIAEFRVYCAGQLHSSLINDPANCAADPAVQTPFVHQYALGDWAAGDYICGVAAFDTAGRESAARAIPLFTVVVPAQPLPRSAPVAPPSAVVD